MEYCSDVLALVGRADWDSGHKAGALRQRVRVLACVCIFVFFTLKIIP
jgi:hypothetical protein